MLVSGRLHASRGALFPALQAIGLSEQAVRRSWAAFRYGAWTIGRLMSTWRKYVEEQGRWQAHTHAGYRVKAVDITGYWRPTLQGIQSKHYEAEAEKALPAVPVGLIGLVGSLEEQRLALLTDLVRAELNDASEVGLTTKLLQRVVLGLQEDEMPVFDAGFHLHQLFEAGLSRFVVRLAKNFTARRNTVTPNATGRPLEYGEPVRPLSRTYQGRTIAATAPDQVETWASHGLQFRAECWDNLVLPDVKADPANPTFSVVAIYDPRFDEPWLLACPLKFSGAVMREFYYDRWPIEQLPLAAKHMVGANRQFVFAPESCQRLPELSLLAGSIQTYLAASLPPLPTGFWDRHPKRTPGRLRRLLAQVSFSNLSLPWPERIRKKATVFEHLPKGILAHQRSKRLNPA